jgi:hypothetical protein
MNSIISEKAAAAEAEKKQDILSWWEGKIGRNEYIRVIYLLQDRAGLSFKEARAWLLPHQFVRRLSEDWNCTEENIYKFRRRAADKIRAAAGTEKNVLQDIPAAYYHIL